MITIDIEAGKSSSRFIFMVSVDGVFHERLMMNALSSGCIRIVADSCAAAAGLESTPVKEAVNAAITRKAYDMGYKRMVFSARPEVLVTKFARLQRKARLEWCYIIPLEELYG